MEDIAWGSCHDVSVRVSVRHTALGYMALWRFETENVGSVEGEDSQSEYLDLFVYIRIELRRLVELGIWGESRPYILGSP